MLCTSTSPSTVYNTFGRCVHSIPYDILRQFITGNSHGIGTWSRYFKCSVLYQRRSEDLWASHSSAAGTYPEECKTASRKCCCGTVTDELKVPMLHRNPTAELIHNLRSSVSVFLLAHMHFAASWTVALDHRRRVGTAFQQIRFRDDHRPVFGSLHVEKRWQELETNVQARRRVQSQLIPR